MMYDDFCRNMASSILELYAGHTDLLIDGCVHSILHIGAESLILTEKLEFICFII